MDLARPDSCGEERRAAEPWPALPLAALWGLVVAQPLYDLLSSAPEFFIEHGVSAVGVFVFTLLLSVVAPLGLAVVVLVGRRVLGTGVGSALFLGVVAVLGAAMGAQISRQVDSIPAFLAVALAVAAGIALALAYRKSRLFSQALAWLVLPAWTLIPGLFLLSSPIRSLWTAPTVAVETGSARETPVVVIVFDELPLASLVHTGDEIDVARYPHFADLASHSTWHRTPLRRPSRLRPPFLHSSRATTRPTRGRRWPPSTRATSLRRSRNRPNARYRARDAALSAEDVPADLRGTGVGESFRRPGTVYSAFRLPRPTGGTICPQSIKPGAVSAMERGSITSARSSRRSAISSFPIR